MGSSKKHKEKRDRKKHKRSRSRERDGHKKSHKSSHRRDKTRSSPDLSNTEIQSPEHLSRTANLLVNDEIREKTQKRSVSDDEFDVDKLLDSKLSENAEFATSALKPPSKKRRRMDALEELKKRHNLGINEDSLEKFVTEQMMEELGQPSSSYELPRSQPSSSVRIKEEPSDDHSFAEENHEPQLSLSIAETNKLRAKLGLKPLDVGRESSGKKDADTEDNISIIRSKLGLKSSDTKSEPPSIELTEPQLSLSVADTNKLRAKLGLKPLDVGSAIPGIENEEKEISKPAAEVFVKTENLSEKKKSEALREKLKVMKEKRAIEEKLKKSKGIADSDSEDESAAAWVMKHQKILLEKEAAEKRAKMLEEMDEEFGIGALVEEEFDKSKAYTANNLRGLTVAHDVGSFREGHDVILTLKDKGVLEEDEDVLENVNIVDTEKYAKNVENKKKKPDYKPYDEPEYDEFGILKKKNLLYKYDEEIDGEKKKTFKLGNVSTTPYLSKEQELEMIRMKLKQQNEMTLDMPEMKKANEYYTAEDMVQFKKPKKKKKVKKSSLLKADDLLPDTMAERDFGSRRRRRIDPDEDEEDAGTSSSGIPLISDFTAPNLDVIEEDQAEKELHSALNKAKKLKKRQIMATAPEKVMQILSSVDGGLPEIKKESKGAAVNIELNSVAEFCRTLGEIPTYGMSGNRDEEGEDMMDLERELLEERQKQELEAQNQGAWNEVDIEEKPAEILMRENEPILEEEPDISLGVSGALKLATKKGYLDKDLKKSSAPKSSQLQAQSYTIEEKFYEDDKFGKRDRYTGPVQEFREKNNYKPDVKLEYIDDSGRLLTAKEAFRYLSHKFHGKGPGKNKVDKRMKKLDQDTRLKQMSSTDTPLNTVKLLQLKQKETQSPYIVLSGGNKTLTQTMISKTKPV